MSFAKAVAHALKIEGGYVDNPLDPGGRTNRGITQHYLDVARIAHPDIALPADVKDITDDIAAQLYHVNEWEWIQGDALPDAVAFVMFDFAVNSGPDEAIRCLQRATKIFIDGKLGPQTLAAAKKPGTVAALSVERLLYLAKLKAYPTFGHGWFMRVIDTALGAFQ